ncbi:MAG: hypothetical protein FWE70_06400, partial [Oscillospiraceae bacterium]|nr:hypothetical protein [Oscillospiraceae bacterium]
MGMGLSHKDRFNGIFEGRPVDRAPFLDYMGRCNYGSCLARWKREGLEADATWADVRSKVGFDYERGYCIGARLLFWPEFEVRHVRREGDRTYAMNRWGGLEMQTDGSELMPITLEGPVRDRRSWDGVRQRLVGDYAGRLPKDLEKVCAEAAASDLPIYMGDLPAGFFGGPREVCGFDDLIFMFHDDPDLLSEILDTLCDLWIGVYSEVQRRVALDYVFIWEDMCFKGGPLIGPDLFREFLLPRYVRLTSAVRAGGCRHFLIDSDGDGRPLVP